MTRNEDVSREKQEKQTTKELAKFLFICIITVMKLKSRKMLGFCHRGIVRLVHSLITSVDGVYAVISQLIHPKDNECGGFTFLFVALNFSV